MQKNFLLYTLCHACLLIGLANSCKKESVPEKPYLEVPDNVWSYIRLTPGSWYIYKDSATGLTDSVNVTASSVKFRNPEYNPLSGNISSYSDEFNLILETVDPSGNRSAWLNALSRTVIYPAATSPNYWEFNDPIHHIILFQYPANLPGSVENYKIPSAVIEGHSYSDIQVVKGSIGTGPAEVWWVKTIGIVKLTRFADGEIKTAWLLTKK